MKKLVVLGLAAVMALGAPFSVCAAEEETTVEHPSGLKIGCAVQTMSNQVWAQQMEEITKDEQAWANDYIFKKPNGDTYYPSIAHRFGKLLKKYDLPHIRFHDLRHMRKENYR